MPKTRDKKNHCKNVKKTPKRYRINLHILFCRYLFDLEWVLEIWNETKRNDKNWYSNQFFWGTFVFQLSGYKREWRRNEQLFFAKEIIYQSCLFVQQAWCSFRSFICRFLCLSMWYVKIVCDPFMFYMPLLFIVKLIKVFSGTKT